MRGSPAEMKAQNWQLLTGAIILSLAVIVQCQGRSRILYNYTNIQPGDIQLLLATKTMINIGEYIIYG